MQAQSRGQGISKRAEKAQKAKQERNAAFGMVPLENTFKKQKRRTTAPSSAGSALKPKKARSSAQAQSARVKDVDVSSSARGPDEAAPAICMPGPGQDAASRPPSPLTAAKSKAAQRCTTVDPPKRTDSEGQPAQRPGTGTDSGRKEMETNKSVVDGGLSREDADGQEPPQGSANIGTPQPTSDTRQLPEAAMSGASHGKDAAPTTQKPAKKKQKKSTEGGGEDQTTKAKAPKLDAAVYTKIDEHAAAAGETSDEDLVDLWRKCKQEQMDKAKTRSHSDAVLKYMEDMSVADCCKFLRKRINSTKRKILKGIHDGADDASNKDESTGKKEKKKKAADASEGARYENFQCVLFVCTSVEGTSALCFPMVSTVAGCISLPFHHPFRYV
jgi:hypothetical protein